MSKCNIRYLELARLLILLVCEGVTAMKIDKD